MKQDNYGIITDYIVKNQNRFYRLSYSYVQNKDDALDIVQNAICKALEHYDSLKNFNAVKTWFYRILVNECLIFIKKMRVQTLSDEDAIMQIPYHEKGYELCENFNDDLYSCRSHCFYKCSCT